MQVTFRGYEIKIVLRVNSGILHHYMYSKTWLDIKAVYFHLSEQFWYFLKIEDNSIELITPGSKTLTFPNKQGDRPH